MVYVAAGATSSSVGLVCSHLGSHDRRGRAASKHRPSPGGRPADMEASYPAQAPLAQPAAGHYLPPLGSLPASAPPAGRSAVCGRGSCLDPFLIQESSAWRLAACHRHHQADRGRAQRLAARGRPQAHAGGVQRTLVPPEHPLRAGRGAGCAAPQPLERAPPSAAARMTLAT